MFPWFVEYAEEPLNVKLFDKYHVLDTQPYHVHESRPRIYGPRRHRNSNNCTKSWRVTNKLFRKYGDKEKKKKVQTYLKIENCNAEKESRNACIKCRIS